MFFFLLRWMLVSEIMCEVEAGRQGTYNLSYVWYRAGRISAIHMQLWQPPRCEHELLAPATVTARSRRLPPIV